MRKFKAELTSLKEMIRFVHYESERNGFDEALTKKIELAAEEALVNIISYGYEGKKGEIAIGFNSSSPGGLEIIIRDEGLPFNPLEHLPLYNPKLSLDEREPGGCGLLFIKNVMDKIYYRRENNENILTMVKFKPT